MSVSWLIDLGRMGYERAWELQERLVARRVSGEIPDVLLFVEHPPVFTIGRSARRNNILVGDDVLERFGIEVVRTNRGGDITYHGPGQLVGYPILMLGEAERDIHLHMRRIERMLIEAIAGYGLRGERVEGLTGVWVDGAKVAAIGVAARRWVTYHGFALNVDPDMGHFSMITPCGLVGKPVTSLRMLLGRAPDADDVKRRVADSFSQVFGRPLDPVAPEAVL